MNCGDSFVKYTSGKPANRIFSLLHLREQVLAMALTIPAFAVLGPFGTSALPAPSRFAYWAIDIGCGWILTLGFLALLLRNPFTGNWPASAPPGTAVLLAGLPIGLVVIRVEQAFRHNTLGPKIMIRVFFICALIGGMVNMRIRARAGLDPAAPPQTPDTEPAFFKRLPSDPGTGIISLTTRDHYVEVTTAKGSTLVLIRFSDAIAELSGLDGVRIHRSHWVARAAMRKTSRQNGKPVLELVDGRHLPISRTYMATVRAVLDPGKTP
jgi:hypothetical protein